MYPNGQAGYGIIQMEITTNGMYKDTVTWTGDVSGISSINEAHILDKSNVNQIYDLSGRKVNVMQNAGVYIIEYKNHPWFVGVQFHPEYKSTVSTPHPLFKSFVKASLAKK